MMKDYICKKSLQDELKEKLSKDKKNIEAHKELIKKRMK